MTREEVIKQLKKLKSFHNGSYGEALNFAIESITVDLEYNLMYEEAIKADRKKKHKDGEKIIEVLTFKEPQEFNLYKDFCEFVAKMVLSDDFEENSGSNAELLCRKLSKLGIVKADEDKWVLSESEDKI